MNVRREFIDIDIELEIIECFWPRDHWEREYADFELVRGSPPSPKK